MAVFFSITVIWSWLLVLLPAGIRAKLKRQNATISTFTMTMMVDHDDTRSMSTWPMTVFVVLITMPDRRTDSPSDGFELKYRVPFILWRWIRVCAVPRTIKLRLRGTAIANDLIAMVKLITSIHIYICTYWKKTTKIPSHAFVITRAPASPLYAL